VHCIPLDDDDNNARKVEWQNFNPANIKENRYPNHHDKEKEKDGEKKKPQKGSAKPQNGSGKPQNGSGKPQKGSDKPQKGSDKPQKGSDAGNNPRTYYCTSLLRVGKKFLVLFFRGWW
jgi:hypothetical protein